MEASHARVDGNEVEEVWREEFEDGMRLGQVPVGHHGDALH